MRFQFRVVAGKDGLGDLLGRHIDASWHGFCRTTAFSVTTHVSKNGTIIAFSERSH